MTKKRTCELCGENSGKRRICLKHKEDYPYVASGKGGRPFNRSELMEKSKKKKAKMVSPEEIAKEFKNG